MELKMLTDKTVENQFSDFSHKIIKQIKETKSGQWSPKPEPFKIIAHRTVKNGKKILVYVEVNKAVHFVLDRNFKNYFELRRDIPDKVVLFSSLNEISNEVEKKGFIL